jgi:hypothetical protein
MSSKFKEDDKLIAAKSVAFSLSSPIDTFRQNTLTKRKISLVKVINGVFTGLISATCITTPCHKTISAFDSNNNCCQIVAVFCGVLIASIIKTPIMYNYKRVQIGMKMTTKIPMKSLKNVASISLVEDVIEESVKYTLYKYRLRNKSTHTLVQTCAESFLLFAISYPFDILKNRGMYGISNLKGDKLDFISKAIHKNLQNVFFFQLLTVSI